MLHVVIWNLPIQYILKFLACALDVVRILRLYDVYLSISSTLMSTSFLLLFSLSLLCYNLFRSAIQILNYLVIVLSFHIFFYFFIFLLVLIFHLYMHYLIFAIFVFFLVNIYTEFLMDLHKYILMDIVFSFCIQYVHLKYFICFSGNLIFLTF